MSLALQTHVYASPLFWAVFVGWMMSVVLHEFAHGIVAHFGGDYTIRERGGLTLNPLQYVDPVGSILLPLIFLLLGGIPLPGGVTYIRRDLLRTRGWDAAVSLAGPAMNVLLFLLCMLPMHPSIGWIDVTADADSGPAAVLATLGQLQLLSVFINLIPVPPLDGFQAISAFMDGETRMKFFSPHVVLFSTLLLFTVLWNTRLIGRMYEIGFQIMGRMGFDVFTQAFFADSFNAVLRGAR